MPLFLAAHPSLLRTLPPVVLRELVIPEPSEMLLRTQLINLLDLGRGEFKCHRAEVIRQPLFLSARGDGNNVLVDTPTQQDLALVDCVLFGEAGEKVVYWTSRGLGDGGQGAVG